MVCSEHALGGYCKFTLFSLIVLKKMPTPKMSYRWCYVPYCGNTTKKTPDKLFFCVPLDEERQKQWFCAARRKSILPKTTQLFCCEDHFNLKEDMENYVKYSLMGTGRKLKNNVLPHIFNCQTKRKGARQGQAKVAEILEESEEDYEDKSLNDTEKVWLVNQELLHDELFIAENGNVQIKNENNSDTETHEENNLRVKQKSSNDEIIVYDDLQIKEENSSDNETIQDCGKNCKETSIDSKQCNECNNYLEDTLTVQTGNKQFECEYCQRKFIRKHHLKNHLLIHIGVDLFECEKCNKKFRTKTALRRHEMSHTVGKSFKCKDCNKKFAQKLDLGQQHFLQYTGIDPRTNKKRQKTCKVCRDDKNKRTCVITYCDQCEGNPGFCVPCFKNFHL